MAINKEILERALVEINKGYAQYDYFFDHLNSPIWLEPLWREGFFRKPPQPKREGGFIQFGIWPESRYLLRMARIEAAQPKVLEITLGIPDTENGRIHDDVADIALALPPPLAARLVPQISRYLKIPFKLLLAEETWKLIVHLSEGEQRAALDLARAALALSSDPRIGEADTEKPRQIPDPRTRFDDWHYARIAQKAAPALAGAFGLDAVRLFSELLDTAARFSTREPDKGEEDYFYIRYPAIEHFPSRYDPASWLLWAVRTSAVIAIADNATVEAVLEVLRQYKWTLFRRIELHLANHFPERRNQLAEELFSTPAILERDSLTHEAVLLLKESFSGLSHERQQQLLQWMDAGPPEDLIRAFLDRFSGEPVTAEAIERVKNTHRRNRLAMIEGQLPEPYLQRYETLKNDLGAAPAERPPIRAFYQKGAQSPKSPEELEGMSIHEILELLTSWKPGTDIFQPTAEGLGSALTSIVSHRAVEFVATTERFKTLDPTYVRSFFAGLTQALRDGEQWDWAPILELAAWVTSRPREIEGREGGLLVADPDWGWTRNSIIDLLKTGFEVDAGRIRCEYRALVWRVLEPLTNDAFPSVDDEKGEKYDPLFLSINSTRGRAFETVLDYASWVRGCLSTGMKQQGQATATFEAMPEVRQALDRHLDIGQEPTLAIRSIYGLQLSSLALLDWGWLVVAIPLIFPVSHKLSRYFSAAWESFVVFNRPAEPLLREMIPVYRKAISEIPEGPRMVRSPESAVERLAQHLMAYYWWGLIEFGSEDGLLDQFYEVAPDEVRGQAMWFVGRSAAAADDTTPRGFFERLCNLAERRVWVAESSGRPDSFARELANFGYWFTSEKFGDKWSIEMLLRTLRLTKATEDSMYVLKRLSELGGSYPTESVECLHLMVQGGDPWLLVGSGGSAIRLLRAAMDGNQPAAMEAAIRLVQDLIARGHYEFRELLP